MPQKLPDAVEIELQWVHFHGEGVLLDGAGGFYSRVLTANQRRSEWPPDYRLPRMMLNTQTNTLSIGKDRISASAIRQYRVF